MRRGIGEFSPEALERAGVDQTVVELTGAFFGVMEHMRDHVEAVAAGYDLNAPSVLTLRMLGDPLAQRDIAEAAGCDPSYVTAIVDRLEDVGAVERQPDPDDRRVKRVVLTEDGRRLRERVGIDLLAGVVFARALDAGEREQLLDLLTRALAALDTAESGDGPGAGGEDPDPVEAA